MNANESKLPGTLTARIQKVSAGLKTLFLIAAVISAVVGICATITMFESYDGEKLEDATGLVIWAALYWCAFKLFRACSRGNLFSAEVVRSLRRIGALAILLGLVEGTISFASAYRDIPLWLDLMVLPFYSFSIVPGVAFLCVAWIMDEGRKIREEQELTV
ncbi:MAG TPA: DUF2975 domain-containing protein [Verrucomicrobiae bacterium]|nr:DUF2975 domain-containing protein [Verrucomicrobiae bacterium]